MATLTHPSTANTVTHTAPRGGPPPGGYGGNGGEVGETRDDGEKRVYVTFSAQTCLELLPKLTDQQLEFETKYFKSLLGTAFECKSTVKKSPTALTKALTKQLQCDVKKIVTDCNIYDEANSSFCMLLERAEQLLDSVKTNATLHNTTQVDCPTAPVSFLPASVQSSVEDCCSGVTFRTVGEREVEYFGAHPYPYGRTKHTPKPYPETPIFRTIVDAITKHDPDFDLDTYSCLVTQYKDGNSFILPHSDDEYGVVK